MSEDANMIAFYHKMEIDELPLKYSLYIFFIVCVIDFLLISPGVGNQQNETMETTPTIYKSSTQTFRGKSWTLDSGLDLWTELWTDI